MEKSKELAPCSETTMDKQLCSMVQDDEEQAQIVAPRDGTAASAIVDGSETIPFHKHCQKTVCSAYGYQGQGKTWNVLYDQRNNLVNLGSDWINFFNGHGEDNENITYDLLAILKLINRLATTVGKKWTLTFKAGNAGNNSDNICSKLIDPWENTNLEYKFPNFSRNIVLTVDGKELKFNTMKDLGNENLSITLEKHNLNITFNGVDVGSAQDIYMPYETTIDINQDFNKHPTCGYSGYISESGYAPVDGTYHVYRHHEGGTTITPSFAIDSKYIPTTAYISHSPIIEWEFHLRNNGTSILTVNEPDVKVGNDTTFFTAPPGRKVALTDQMYVEPGMTNVYVFRAEMYSTIRVLTYSLAYIY